MNQRSLHAAIALLVAAATTPAFAYDFEDWPVHHAFGDGSDLALYGVYRYDVNDFSGDAQPNGTHAFEDAHTNRRKELGVTLKKKGVYDAVVGYEYQGKAWQDVNLRLYSKAFLGTDVGAFRFGYSKTPVSFEGVTSSKATTGRDSSNGAFSTARSTVNATTSNSRRAKWQNMRAICPLP